MPNPPDQVTTQGNTPATTTSSGGSTVSDIQRFAQGIYSFDSDKTFYTYELSELKALPKSLFYDAATSDGVYRGLFSYYVLGTNRGNKVPYYKSESKTYLPDITPIESRNPTAKMIIDTVSKKNGKIPAYLDPSSPYRGQVYNVKDFIFCKHYGVMLTCIFARFS